MANIFDILDDRSEWPHQRLVAHLRAHPERLTEVDDFSGRLPLHFAAKLGDTESCRLLLLAGAELHVRDRNGWTPLEYAIEKGFLDTVTLLLDGGALLAVANPEKLSSLLSLAAFVREPERSEVIDLLLSRGVSWDLDAAVRCGRLDALRELHQARPALISEHPQPGELLRWAVDSPSADALQYLLSNGLSPNADVSRAPSILWHALAGNFRTIPLLLEHGADPNAPGRDGGTLLAEAVRRADEGFTGYKGVVHALRKHGVRE